MKQEQMLRLRADAELIRQGDRLGVTRQGKSRMARDALQDAILRQLESGVKNLDALQDELCRQNQLPLDSPEIALALVGFILDFGYYIEGKHPVQHNTLGGNTHEKTDT